MATPAESRPVLVTGASGRVGRLLVPALHALCPEVDWHPLAREVADRAGALPEVRAVVALWGVTQGDADALGGNAALATRAQEIAEAAGADRVLHMSSLAVYPAEVDAPDETTPPDPPNAYGRAKLEMEQRLTSRSWDAQPVILRCCNVVGADSLAPALARGEARITVFPGGHGPLRAMIAPGDLARVICGLIALPRDRLPGILNVAAPGVMDMTDIAAAAGCAVTPVEAGPGDRPRAALSVRRATNLLPGAIRCDTATKAVADWQRWRATR